MAHPPSTPLSPGASLPIIATKHRMSAHRAACDRWRAEGASPDDWWLILAEEMSRGTACDRCGSQLAYEPSQDAFDCWKCAGPELICSGCGCRYHEREEHTVCEGCRVSGRAECGCRACRDPLAARARRYKELRQVRRTVGGTRDPSPRSVYEAVIASGPCVYCGTPATVADHVRPLARGGDDDTGNLVPACASCNQSKWQKLITEWDQARVARAVRCSPVVAVEYARLTGGLVGQAP